MPQLARRPFAFSIIAMIVCGVCEASPASCASANQEQAAAAVAQAQTAVSHAAEAGALWLNAREALDKALRAQAQRDHRTACREAISAADFARMGIEQLGYPLYRH